MIRYSGKNKNMSLSTLAHTNASLKDNHLMIWSNMTVGTTYFLICHHELASAALGILLLLVLVVGCGWLLHSLFTPASLVVLLQEQETTPAVLLPWCLWLLEEWNCSTSRGGVEANSWWEQDEWCMWCWCWTDGTRAYCHDCMAF